MKVIFVVLFLTAKTCTSLKRDIKLTTIQGTGSLDGLGCAVDEPLLYSGVKFDTQTGTCTKLPKNWFASPSYEPNHTYFKLKELGYNVPETSVNNTLIPDIFIPGGRVMMLVETTDTPNSGLTMIDFVNVGFTRSEFSLYGTVALHNKLEPPNYRLTSFISGSWGAEEGISYPFTQAYTSYKIDWYFTDTQVGIYVDGTLLYSYNHRTSLDMYGRVWFYDDVNLILRLVWFGYY